MIKYSKSMTTKDSDELKKSSATLNILIFTVKGDFM